LIQAVKRNIERFPDDFMFQLSPPEFSSLKSQMVTSSWGGLRKPPHAFQRITEQAGCAGECGNHAYMPPIPDKAPTGFNRA